MSSKSKSSRAPEPYVVYRFDDGEERVPLKDVTAQLLAQYGKLAHCEDPSLRAIGNKRLTELAALLVEGQQAERRNSRGRSKANQIKKTDADTKVLNIFISWQYKNRLVLAVNGKPLSNEERVAKFKKTRPLTKARPQINRRISQLLKEGKIPPLES